jgi:hypothetical protein
MKLVTVEGVNGRVRFPNPTGPPPASDQRWQRFLVPRKSSRTVRPWPTSILLNYPSIPMYLYGPFLQLTVSLLLHRSLAGPSRLRTRACRTLPEPQLGRRGTSTCTLRHSTTAGENGISSQRKNRAGHATGHRRKGTRARDTGIGGDNTSTSSVPMYLLGSGRAFTVM